MKRLIRLSAIISRWRMPPFKTKYGPIVRKPVGNAWVVSRASTIVKKAKTPSEAECQLLCHRFKHFDPKEIKVECKNIPEECDQEECMNVCGLCENCDKEKGKFDCTGVKPLDPDPTGPTTMGPSLGPGGIDYSITEAPLTKEEMEKLKTAAKEVSLWAFFIAGIVLGIAFSIAGILFWLVSRKSKPKANQVGPGGARTSKGKKSQPQPPPSESEGPTPTASSISSATTFTSVGDSVR